VTFVASGIAEKNIFYVFYSPHLFTFLTVFIFLQRFLFKEKRWKNGMRIL